MFIGQCLFCEDQAVYEIISKNMVEPERRQMAIWRCGACWVSKVTRTQAHARVCAPTHARTRTQKYVVCTAFSWLRERATMLRYTCISSHAETSPLPDVSQFCRVCDHGFGSRKGCELFSIVPSSFTTFQPCFSCLLFTKVTCWLVYMVVV